MDTTDKILNFTRRIPLIGPRLLKQFKSLIFFLWRMPLLSKYVNRYVTNFEATRTTPRPRPFSLWSPAVGTTIDYTSWPSLTNRHFSARHLPPATEAYTRSLPFDSAYSPSMPTHTQNIGDITALFTRNGDMKTDRSSLLFMFFAQWFTDSILRVDSKDRRKNTSNHEIDLCQIYGLTEETCQLLRTKANGKLKCQTINGETYLDYLCEPNTAGGWQVKPEYNALPYSQKVDDILKNVAPARKEKLYATGLERGNSSIGYVAISTLFMREHNRICDGLIHHLHTTNATWLDEQIFQTARMINIILLLKLVVQEYINHISLNSRFVLDVNFAEKKPWYRTNWIAIEFDLLYRWHGLVPSSMLLNKQTRTATDFRFNNALLEEVGLAEVINSASTQAAGRIGLFNTPDFLMGAEYLSLKMSRDFRLRSYNDYREQFGLDRLRHFSELTPDTALCEILQKHYKDIDSLEFLIGLLGEAPGEGELFGELMKRMVGYDAFTQIYTNPLLSKNVFNEKTLTAYGMQLIESTHSLQDLANRNITHGQKIKASLAFC
jgi:prostaglandin-endoperoxide synthase 2